MNTKSIRMFLYLSILECRFVCVTVSRRQNGPQTVQEAKDNELCRNLKEGMQNLGWILDNYQSWAPFKKSK